MGDKIAVATVITFVVGILAVAGTVLALRVMMLVALFNWLMAH